MSIYLISEAGLNHNGNLGMALEMIDQCAEIGVSCIKFQKREIEVSTPKEMWYKKREWCGEIVDYISYRRMVEFGKDQYDAIDAHCKKVGIRWTASVWDQESVDFMAQYDVPFIKIPSAHLTNSPLVQKVYDSGVPLVISTGMSTEEEIQKALSPIKAFFTGSSLMHCTSTYPCADSEINLGYMEELRVYGLPVGFSSHSDSPYPPIIAAAMGAKSIEAHYTLNRALPGTDQAASLEYKGMALLKRELERIPVLVGDGTKRVFDSELPSRLKLRGY
jgi:N-acetylneuraminate synthase